MKNRFLFTARRIALVLAGAFLLAFNVNTFVRVGELYPGSFLGLALLIQETFLHYGKIHLPYSLIYFSLNLVPAIICFKFIGKKFTLFSVIAIVTSGFLTDWMPHFMPAVLLNFINTQDVLLCAVFGGLINALAISFTLHADASIGGTYFIGTLISEKLCKDSFNYVFAINCGILAVAGILFGLERALYSIIFQFATTMALRSLYRNYQQRTLLIVTNKPEEIHKTIYETTRHGATLVDCFGSFEKDTRTLLYSVVTASQVKKLIPAIRKIDSEAFINVLETEQLNGRFRLQPRD